MAETVVECAAPRLALQALDQAAIQNAGIAQLVEHLIRNEGVLGSSPSTGTKSSCDDRSILSRSIRISLCWESMDL